LRLHVGTDYRDKFITHGFDLFVVGYHRSGSFPSVAIGQKIRRQVQATKAQVPSDKLQ
jgi:hypothetical protein